jgi:hypothetical protein
MQVLLRKPEPARDLWRSASMTAEWAVTRRVRINARLSCDITCGPGGVCVEWIGRSPRGLSAAGQRRYRAGRDAVLAEVARKLGGGVLLIEV